jgi:predicted class III extradiol MEMO1 family dioxygenase
MRNELVGMLGLDPVRLQASRREMAQIERDNHLRAGPDRRRQHVPIVRVRKFKAIDQILALDARKLFDTVRDEKISMCGYAAAVAVLIAARELGATQAELVRYANSGEVNGDLQEVVGYAGIIIK